MVAFADLAEVGGVGCFHVAVCVLAFHHMEKPQEVTVEIANRLVQGGVFVLVDFFTHAEMPMEGLEHVVAHNGFEKEEVERWFQAAGLGEPTWVEVGRMGEGGKGWTIIGKDDNGEVLKMERSVFMAVGKKI
jgi:SAM-dependent methyltransferase